MSVRAHLTFTARTQYPPPKSKDLAPPLTPWHYSLMVIKVVKEANGQFHRHPGTEMQTLKGNSSRFDTLIKC